MKKLITILLFFIMQSTHAMDNTKINIDLQSISIQDALHLIAKKLNKNIIINSAVTGIISLHLHDVTIWQAFDEILAAQGLEKFTENGILFVEKRDGMVFRKQQELKRQEILLATNPLADRIWQIRYAKAEVVLHMIQDANHSLLSKRGCVQLDARTNQIYVRDVQENIDVVAKLIKVVDVPVKQVLIEARLASVDSDFERDLGVNFSVQSDKNDRQNFDAVSAAVGRYALAVAKLPDGSLLDVKLAALENEGHGELISSPSLFTANQQPASIESGEEIPYQEVSRSGGTGVAFKKAVLSLRVTPHILPNACVELELQVNQDRPSARVVMGVPAITTRQISSHVRAANGQTIVLGGIFESTKDAAYQRIPFLSKIPVLGLLFQQQNRTTSRRELLIFVTPKIIDAT